MFITNQGNLLALPLFQILMLVMSTILSIYDIKTLQVSPIILKTITPCIFFFYALEVGLTQFYFLSFTGLCLISYFILYLFPDHIGGGDVKLLLTWSLVLSPTEFIWLLFYASSSALLFILIQSIVTRKITNKIPFVPFLTTGLFLIFL